MTRLGTNDHGRFLSAATLADPDRGPACGEYEHEICGTNPNAAPSASRPPEHRQIGSRPRSVRRGCPPWWTHLTGGTPKFTPYGVAPEQIGGADLGGNKRATG